MEAVCDYLIKRKALKEMHYNNDYKVTSLPALPPSQQVKFLPQDQGAHMTGKLIMHAGHISSYTVEHEGQ